MGRTTNVDEYDYTSYTGDAEDSYLGSYEGYNTYYGNYGDADAELGAVAACDPCTTGVCAACKACMGNKTGACAKCYQKKVGKSCLPDCNPCWGGAAPAGGTAPPKGKAKGKATKKAGGAKATGKATKSRRSTQSQAICMFIRLGWHAHPQTRKWLDFLGLLFRMCLLQADHAATQSNF